MKLGLPIKGHRADVQGLFTILEGVKISSG